MRHERLSQDFGKHSMLVLVLLLMASALVALSPTAPWAGLNVDAHAAGLANPAALEPHAPIHITSDDGFNTSNGVRGGTGTAAAPYLISDWLVDAALYPNSSAMIWLENTDRHVVVQNCQVIHLDTVGEQFQAFYVGKYPGENMTPIIGPPTIDLTSNVTFLDNDIESRYGYGIQIAEGSSNILAKGNHVAIHPDNVSGLANGWTRAITVRESALNASLVHNTIRVELTGIIIGASTGRWDTYGSVTSANNTTIRDNVISNVTSGIQIGNVSGTQVIDTTFANVGLQELNLNGEGGAPRNLTLTDLAFPVRIRAPTEAIPIHWSWTHLTPSAEYNLSATNGTTTVNVSFATTAAGVGFVDVEQPRTNATNLTVYRLAGPLPPPNAPPTADFVWAPTLGNTSTMFVFTAQASDDHDLPSSIQVRWDWTGDGTWDTAWSTNKTATHSYSSIGNKTSVVQAIDSGGLTATQSHAVQVPAPPPPPPPPPPPNAPPTVDFTWTPNSGDTTTVFTFTAQASDDHDQPSAIQVRWDWDGDGTWDTPWSTTKTATHTFSAAGDYTVAVRAIDSGGLTTSKSHLVSVTALPPPPNRTNPVSTQTQILLLLASVSTPIMIVTAIGVIVYAVSRARRRRGRRD